MPRNTPVQVRLTDGTVWLSQRLMAELFYVTVPTVNELLQGIYDDAEFEPAATARKFRIVQTEANLRVNRVAYPIAQHILRPEHSNRAYEVVRQKFPNNLYGAGDTSRGANTR